MFGGGTSAGGMEPSARPGTRRYFATWGDVRPFLALSCLTHTDVLSTMSADMASFMEVKHHGSAEICHHRS